LQLEKKNLIEKPLRKLQLKFVDDNFFWDKHGCLKVSIFGAVSIFAADWDLALRGRRPRLVSIRPM